MDLICTNCGEPWEMDYVFHDDPEAFTRKHGAIVACPCCPTKPPKHNKATRERLAAARELAYILEDDPDGYAAMLEDFGLVD